MIQTVLPAYDYTLLIRTDFSDDAAWERLCAEMQQVRTPYGFRAMIECIADRACQGLNPAAVLALLPPDAARLFVLIADARTFSDTEQPVLVVDLQEQPGRSFRVIPAEAWSVENNLRIAHLGFDEFLAVCDPQGVYRGFPDAPF
jgi:hypothetical protein